MLSFALLAITAKLYHKLKKRQGCYLMKIDYEKLAHEIEIIFAELALHLDYWDAKNNGLQPVHNGWVDYKFIQRVEKFMAHIRMTKSPLFREMSPGNFVPQPSAREFATYDFIFSVRLFDDQYPYLYSKVINTFLTLYKKYYQQRKIYLLQRSTDIPENYNAVAANMYMIERLSPAQISNVNEFVGGLRELMSQNDFKEKQDEINQRIGKRYKAYADYIDALHQTHGSLTFIALDFCMPHNYQDPYFDPAILKLRNAFFKKGPSTRSFNHVVGYMGKWEESASKQIYFRTIFILPSADVVDAKAIAKLLAIYWVEEITEGKGICHHAHLATGSPKFKRTICHITEGDKSSRDLFKERVVTYITKSEKYYAGEHLVKVLTPLNKSLSASTESTTDKDRAFSLAFRGNTPSKKPMNISREVLQNLKESKTTQRH